MGDFGTMVIVQRSDGRQFSNIDRTHVEAMTERLKQTRPQDTFEDPLKFHVAEYRGIAGVEGVTIDLTQHWLEDTEAEGVEPETVLEQELPFAESTYHTLQSLLGEDYSLELVCDSW